MKYGRHDDEDEILKRKPVAPTVRVIRDRNRRAEQEWDEADRLGRIKLWGPVAQLPVPEDGDDFFPPLIHPRTDRLCC